MKLTFLAIQVITLILMMRMQHKGRLIVNRRYCLNPFRMTLMVFLLSGLIAILLLNWLLMNQG